MPPKPLLSDPDNLIIYTYIHIQPRERKGKGKGILTKYQIKEDGIVQRK